MPNARGTRPTTKPYVCLGIVLTVIGIALASIAYFLVASVPLTAAGMSTVILGLTVTGFASSLSFAGSESRGRISKSQMILLICLALSFAISDGLLAFFQQRDLGIYVTIVTIVYLVCSWAYVAIDSRSRTSVFVITWVVFLTFMVTMGLKIANALRREP